MLMDLVANPEFAHRLLRRLTDARCKWVQERAAFLGIAVEPGVLSNDEVNCPSLSPALYEEMVLPYEQELCEFHGRIVYWHSCGNTTELAWLIARIPVLDLFHIGPWTDATTVRESMKPETALEKCLMPTRDVYFADPATMAKQLRQLRAQLDGRAYTIRADAFQVVGDFQQNLARIKEWCEVARTELQNDLLRCRV
jgi:uroporphyrinogen-III decarboxylase